MSSSYIHFLLVTEIKVVTQLVFSLRSNNNVSLCGSVLKSIGESSKSLRVIQFLHLKIFFLKRSTNENLELLKNTAWPPVWSIVAEGDKTRPLLKQHYRKPLTRESINTPATPIETSVVTTLCVWGITSHCLLPICGLLPRMKNKFDSCWGFKEKKGGKKISWVVSWYSSQLGSFNYYRKLSFDLFCQYCSSAQAVQPWLFRCRYQSKARKGIFF